MCFIFDFFCEHYFYRLRIKRSLALWEPARTDLRTPLDDVFVPGGANKAEKKLCDHKFWELWWFIGMQFLCFKIRLWKPRAIFLLMKFMAMCVAVENLQQSRAFLFDLVLKGSWKLKQADSESFHLDKAQRGKDSVVDTETLHCS